MGWDRNILVWSCSASVLHLNIRMDKLLTVLHSILCNYEGIQSFLDGFRALQKTSSVWLNIFTTLNKTENK